jgi:hypothetical protein
VRSGLCRRTSAALPNSDETSVWNDDRRYPNDPFLQRFIKPTVAAITLLEQNKFSDAIAALEIAKPYEGATIGPMAGFWPTFVRWQAYLKLGDGAKAATQFQTILDLRGRAP